MVANGLAFAGDDVHVWCPSGEQQSAGSSQQPANSDQHSAISRTPVVHGELGCFTGSDLRKVDRALNQFPAPRRLLVQWVPHGYGYRAMNLHFCLWLWQRARGGDRVELMVHEPFLCFGEGSWKQAGVAAVHRLMIMILLRAASRVWVSIPTWEKHLRPYALGRELEFNWLPVPSNIPVVNNPKAVREIRARYTRDDGALVGHFGTCDRNITDLLLKTVPLLLENGRPQTMLLVGRGSELMRAALIQKEPALAARVYATGGLATPELSLHLSACDVMLQPYIDGVSSRRGSTMVALAHGVPVVTTSGRLTEPFWIESAAVALTPVENLSGLVEATKALLPDVETKTQMSAASRILYAERFDVSHVVARLREPASQ